MKLPIPQDIHPSISLIPELTCKSCSLSFLTAQDLALHQSEVQKERLREPGVFEIPSKIENPQPPSDKSELTCFECSKIFSTEKGLHQHEGKIHNFSKRSFKCQICYKKFRDQSALKFHSRQVHERSTRVSCEDCKQTFYSKYVFDKHLKNCAIQEL
ncbi:unnamed protein product [Blepharisma stoltei]|uniref:C2H2-type domain-containing protein n=1 Tax=Blepharisma stoltei TaxID=1481888 RepID=A0AAU9K207_9CILI|nr:unnamed protein product [Blepharisma stoltei]